MTISLLLNGNPVQELPEGTGIQVDFPVPASPQDTYIGLIWDAGNKGWLDAAQVINDGDVSETISGADGLYQLLPTQTTNAFYRLLATEEYGTFVLVQK